MEWKSGISQIPRGTAEKRRKRGIIPPKAEWLACLSIELAVPRREYALANTLPVQL